MSHLSSVVSVSTMLPDTDSDVKSGSGRAEERKKVHLQAKHVDKE